METEQTEDELFSVTVRIDGNIPLTLAKEVTKMKAMKVVAEEKRFLSFYHEEIAPRRYKIVTEEVKNEKNLSVGTPEQSNRKKINQLDALLTPRPPTV